MRLRHATLILPMVLAGACGSAPGDRPNILLISIDTLRADRLGVYGNTRGLTPFLDSLGTEGTVVDECLAESTWTLPSHWTLMLGQGPATHGVWANHLAYKGPSPPLAVQLKAAGYETAAFVGGGNVASEHGFDLGFDLFDDQSRFGGGVLADYLDRLLEWAAADHDEPYFLFLHMYDVHGPYEPDEEFLRRVVPEKRAGERSWSDPVKKPSGPRRSAVVGLERLYDAEVAELDASLEALFAVFEREGLLDHTIVTVVSDHGEAFMEHGKTAHQGLAFAELARVPWLMKGPGVAAGVRVNVRAQLSDVMPTLLGLAGAAVPPMVEGRDLSAWVAGGGGRPEDVAAASIGIGKGKVNRIAYREGPWSFLRQGRQGRLFRVDTDPMEQQELTKQKPDVAARMHASADSWIAAHPVRTAGIRQDFLDWARRKAKEQGISVDDVAAGAGDINDVLEEARLMGAEGLQDDEQRAALLRQLARLGYLDED